MFPKGTIYERQVKNGEFLHLSGSVALKAPLKTRIAYSLMRGIGAGLIGFMIIMIGFTFYPVVSEELAFRFNEPKQIEHDNGFAQMLDIAEAQRIERVQAEAAELGLDSYFSIYIPKIDAKSRIIPNVNPGDEAEYKDALMEGIAHASGTYFPGQNKRIFMFAHSTDSPLNFARYNAVFYLLGKMEVGDRITVYFADEKFEYEVAELKTVAADDTTFLANTGTEEELILQTCDPPGTTWKRLLVIAKPVK